MTRIRRLLHTLLLVALATAPAMGEESAMGEEPVSGEEHAQPGTDAREVVATSVDESSHEIADLSAEAGDAVASAEDEPHEKPRIRWSATALADFHIVDMEDAPDEVGGFFDQYDFTPNKTSALPFELGIGAASLDVIDAEDTPSLQIRFFSPSSNLGLSGSEIDDPFFNQRLDVFARRRGIALDLGYHRFRTEELRVFPTTAGGPLVFQDRTRPDDRFTRERTGFETEIRVRPMDAFDSAEPGFSRHLAPELSFRGGYEDRDGLNQLVFLRSPTNDWLGLRQQMERSASKLGGGILVAPWGLLDVTVDFDHERFRFDSGPILEGQLGLPGPGGSRTVGFVPDTDRSTATARMSTRFGERVRLEGGLQLTHLEQADDLTPDQGSAGLTDNSVTTYAANAEVEIELLRELSLETSFEFDRRNNRIERPTPLFSPANGTQVDEFVKSWRRYVVGGELIYRLRGANTVALGARHEDISRDIEFAREVVGNRRIVPANALIADETRMTTVYARALLRPLRGLRLSGEAGYRVAPRTGYIVDLDDYVYGRARLSYVIPLPRVVVASAHLSGSSGENDDFEMVSGVGAEPPGPPLARNFERSTLGGGITLSGSPVERLSLFASLFVEKDDQKHSLVLSTLPRYFQDGVPIIFSNDGEASYESRQLGLALGGHFRIDEKSDVDLQYTFTRVEARFGNGSPASRLRLLSSNRQIDSEIHDFRLGLRRRLRAGLVVEADYGLQIHDDHAPVPVSVASVVGPFDTSMLQHRITLGVSLTQALFEDDDAATTATRAANARRAE